MQQLSIAIVPTLAAPPKGAQLVIFADPRNYVAEIDSAIMLAAAARYAIKHKVYLVPERFVAANHLCICMLAPDGSVMGLGQAAHLNVSMRQHNFQRGDAVSVFDTPFGKTALLADVDINMPQVCRAAVLQGAQLLISSQYMPLYDFFEDRVKYGAVNAARSNGVQVITAIGAGGAVVDANGHFIVKYTDTLPISAQLELGVFLGDLKAMQTAKDLLMAHRDLIDEPLEAKSNE